MDEGLLSLKWNNHKPAFANLLKVLRKKGCYTDVTLACGSKFFEVHRLVLMACSEFFTNVFDRITCQKPVIVLNEVKSQELEALLDYMYLGEVDVQQKHLPGLIKAAEYLLIKGLAIPDEDPPQNPKPNKIDDEEERPSKRRRQERDSRESERHSRESERVNPNVHIDQQQYSKSGSSDAHKGTSSVNRIPVHQIDEDNEYEVESDNIQPSRVQPDAFSSLNRTHQQDTLHRVENRQNTDSETVSDIKTQDRVDSYSEPDIKTEVCDISEIEEIDSSGVKTELDIRNDNASENSSDFSHFLSSNVEQNLASHMFHSPHQAPGPSGIQRLAGCEVGGGEGIGDEGRSDLFPSHLMGDGLTDGGAPGAQMGEESNGGLRLGGGGLGGSFFSQSEMVGQHRCPYCPQTFMFISILKRHLRTHTGEKPFQCPHCDYRSAYKYHVARHMKLHTSPQDLGGAPLPGFPPDFYQLEPGEASSVLENSDEADEDNIDSLSISRSNI